MKFLIILLFVPLIRCKSFSPITARTSEGCSSMTVGGCEPATEELIETYSVPNSETAAENCQSICQVQEGCNYFTYDSQEEKCFLYQYRYLYNCQIRGASATPTMEECRQRMANSWISSCDSFAWENCKYSGNVVLSKTLITDAHSCQRLLLIIGALFRAEYFVYDYSQHTCIFFDASEAQCDAMSGPDLPNIQDCGNQLFTISPKAPVNASPVYFIAGGSGWGQNIELYHPSIDNLKCSITPPSLNRKWAEHTSFYHSNTVLLCGGGGLDPEDSTASLCISYNNKSNEWKTHTLSISRWYGHKSVVLKNTLYLIGGVDANRSFVGAVSAVSTSLPLTNQPVFTPIPNLDLKRSYPCTAKIDEDTFVITGGWDTYSGAYSGMVTQYNTKTGTTTNLPSLATAREKHGCVLAEINNKKWLIVSGGSGNKYVQSTEMLELGGGAWTSLGNLTVHRMGFSMIATERGVMAIAGYDLNRGNYLNSVELLDWSSKTWKVVQPSIQKNTYMFGGAVPIPASMFDCPV